MLKYELNEGFLIGPGYFGELERDLFDGWFPGDVDDAENLAAGDDRNLIVKLQGHFNLGLVFDWLSGDEGGAAAADVAGQGFVTGFVGWLVLGREIAEGQVEAAGQAVPGAALIALEVVAGLDQEGHDLVFFLAFDQAGGKGPDAAVLLDECDLQAVGVWPVDQAEFVDRHRDQELIAVGRLEQLADIGGLLNIGFSLTEPGNFEPGTGFNFTQLHRVSFPRCSWRLERVRGSGAAGLV